jgi:hypothetical protein
VVVVVTLHIVVFFIFWSLFFGLFLSSLVFWCCCFILVLGLLEYGFPTCLSLVLAGSRDLSKREEC